MDHIKQQRIQASSKAHFLKNSVSFFPLLLSYSSLFLVLYSFNFHFSTFSMKLHNYGIDRHHIFLFCNGLLVFIVKSSGLINNSQSWGMDRHDVGIKCRESRAVLQISKMKALAAAEKTPVEVEEEEGTENGEAGTGEEVDLDVDDEQERPSGREEVEEETEEETGQLSAEELNRKCEDFIQKTKERIRNEAKQLVVLSLLT